MNVRTRLDAEIEALKEYFPKFKIQDPYGENSGVIGKLTSNSGREYVLWLALGAFPNQAPKLYVISPKPLLGYNGQPMASIGSSIAMHMWDPDEHGHPQICHYNGQFWSPNVSLYKILLKGTFWIAAYEQHLKHGKPIDVYLSHMEHNP